jgi:hypothetical protein
MSRSNSTPAGEPNRQADRLQGAQNEPWLARPYSGGLERSNRDTE